MASRTLDVKIIGDARSLSRAFGQSERASSGFLGSMKGMAKVAAVSAGAAGVGLLVVGLKKSIEAAKEAEVSKRKLQTQLKALGISYDQHASQIDKVITSQSRLSAFDDEDLQDSFTNLVRTTGDVNKALELNALVADIARAKNLDLQTASVLVGKVASGNTGVLGRYGIKIKEGATATEALGTLQQKFAGQAEAYGSTTAGAQDRFRVALENLQEKIGTLVLPMLTALIVKGIALVESFEDNWPKIKQTVQSVFDALRPIVEPTLLVIAGLFKTVMALIRGDWSGAWDGIKQVLKNALLALIAIPKTLLTAMFDAAKQLGGKLKDGIVDGVTGLANKLKDLIRGAINAILGLWNNLSIPRVSINVPDWIPGVPDEIAFGPYSLPNIPLLAQGARDFPGGLALVGERGPELLDLPSGSNVIPLTGPQRAITLNVYPSGSAGEDARALASALAWQLRAVS